MNATQRIRGARSSLASPTGPERIDWSRRAFTTAIVLALALVAPAFIAAPAAAFDVTSHVPAFYALGVEPNATITVTFDAPLDQASVSDATVIVRGLGSGVHPANLSVNGAVLTIDPIAGFPPGDIVTVTLTSALEDTNGPNLNGGYTFQFTIRVGGGMLSFDERGRWSTAPAEVPYFLYGGDLDGNGTPDAAAPNEDTHDISVFLNDGDGVFDQHNDYATGTTPSSCYGDDFDRDGDVDLVTANIGSANMTVLLNAGAAASFSSTNYASGTTCRQVYGGDFDGDGDVDLVTTGFSNNTLNLHFNQGNGTFVTPRTVIPVSPGPFPVFVGDMNLDGLPDIIVGFQGTPRQVQIFVNQGGGAFTPGGTLAVGSGAWDLFGNDLDGDGDFDLALAEAQNNRVRIILGNGAGGFTSSILLPTGSFPLAVFTADFDGDHDQEIVPSAFSGRDARVFENAGGGMFPLVDTLPTLQSGSYAWAHDSDLDGDLDLTVVDELADLIFSFENVAEPAGVPPGGVAPTALRLLLPFPDPASTSATIGYEAPPATGPITLRIYDVGGRLVRTLVDGIQLPGGRGQAFWDTRANSGAPVPAGTYLIRLEEGGKTATSRIQVVR